MRRGIHSGVQASVALLLIALVAACAGPADPADDAPPTGTSVAGAGSEAASDGHANDRATVSDGEVLVQPEWDALGRTRDTCGMAGLRRHIGKTVSALPVGTLPADARILSPSDRVAMDYRAERLNVLTAPDGTILQFRCG